MTAASSKAWNNPGRSIIESPHPRAAAATGYREALLAIEGVGAKTLRALALTAELIYGVSASRQDPARFSFAHGGKDRTPYPVDRETYDKTIEVLHRALNKANVARSEKVSAFRRLATFAA